jgi:hypothetical protein
MEEQYSIEESIQRIHDMFNHWTNISLDGEPPYSPLPEESVRLLKEQLECLNKSLAENEEGRKNELKLAGLKKFIIPHEIKISCDEPKWPEPILLEPTRLKPIKLKPIRFEPIWLEPKVLKQRKQKKSDGWRTPNQNPRGPVCRY